MTKHLRPKILLTNPIHDVEQQRLAEYGEVLVAPDTSADTLRALIRDVDGLIVRAQLPQDIFEHAARLRAVVRHGVGLDMIPVEQATRKKIPVANLPGSNTSAVVEYCVSAMLSSWRSLCNIEHQLRTEGWSQARPLAQTTRELAGSCCGIVGFGSIGSRLAEVVHHMGMEVVAYTPRPESLPDYVTGLSKNELFSKADVVVLCCPLNQDTHHFVDKAALEHMKADTLLINVSRGPVVDVAALIQAVKSGRPAGAVLDVHDHQPLKGDEPVFDVPGIRLTPHVAGITGSSITRMSAGAVDALQALLDGRRHPNVVNPDVFES